MIPKATQLRLTNKLIEIGEKKLAELRSQAQETQANLDTLYNQRNSLEADIRMEERDTAQLVKPQPAGVQVEGWNI